MSTNTDPDLEAKIQVVVDFINGRASRPAAKADDGGGTKDTGQEAKIRNITSLINGKGNRQEAKTDDSLSLDDDLWGCL